MIDQRSLSSLVSNVTVRVRPRSPTWIDGPTACGQLYWMLNAVDEAMEDGDAEKARDMAMRIQDIMDRIKPSEAWMVDMCLDEDDEEWEDDEAYP